MKTIKKNGRKRTVKQNKIFNLMTVAKIFHQNFFIDYRNVCR